VIDSFCSAGAAPDKDRHASPPPDTKRYGNNPAAVSDAKYSGNGLRREKNFVPQPHLRSPSADIESSGVNVREPSRVCGKTLRGVICVRTGTSKTHFIGNIRSPPIVCVAANGATSGQIAETPDRLWSVKDYYSVARNSIGFSAKRSLWTPVSLSS